MDRDPAYNGLRMNVLLVTTRFGEGLGGKENYLVSLAGTLISRGHGVRVLARADDPFPEFSGAARFTAFRTGASRPHAPGLDVRILTPAPLDRLWALPVYRLHFYRWSFPLAARCFARAMAGGLAEHVAWSDVVHFDGTGLELLGQAALRACRAAHKPLVVCPHMHPGSWGDAPDDVAFYRDVDGVIAKTSHEARVLEAGGVRRDRIAVIGNGPHLPARGDPEALARRLSSAGPYVLFVGRRTESKGYPALCAAMRAVWASRPDVQLLVLAPLDDPGGGEQGAPGAPDPRIRELPGASEADKDAAYQLARVLCLPSRAEAFGMVLVEAWSHGVPVVASRLPALEEIVTDGEDGLLVEREPERIAAALLALLADPARGRALGEAGRAKVERRYRWDTIAGATEEFYRRAMLTSMG
jgi:glycosyltransferase involved in cell wall biosynthesis